MNHNPLIRDGFGHAYTLHCPGDGPTPLQIKPKAFYDERAARRFLNNLSVREGYWRSLSHKMVGRRPYTGKPLDYLDAISRLLLQGRIQLFQVNELDAQQHPIEKRTFKQADGKTYQFVPPAEQLKNPKKKTKKFSAKNDAIAFVNALNVEGENLRSLANAFGLSPSSKNVQNSGQKALLTAIGDAIIREDILIFVELSNRPPPPKPEYIDGAQSIPGNREVPLSPESPPEEPVETLSFMFQLDTDAPGAKDDEIILQHHESDWCETIRVADLNEIDDDWVQLTFSDPPKSGTFSMLQDPKDDEEPYYVFWDVEYAKLTALTPEGEDMAEIEEEADEDEPSQNAA